MIRAAALPRVRTKQRRRKPMPPWLKAYLVAVVLGCCFVFYRAVKVMLGDNGSMFWLAFDAAALSVNWTCMRHLWRNWRDGE